MKCIPQGFEGYRGASSSKVLWEVTLGRDEIHFATDLSSKLS